ncbi:MAG: LacI family DNA-binding transcriptional regulator [Nakamurella sp.]
MARADSGAVKRPTIADIAQRSGVSIGAVSYALNGLPGVSSETRQRILDIADEIGWRPNISARALSVSRAHAVGLVIARTSRTLGVEPFFMRFIAGLEAELSAAHTALLLQVVENHHAAIQAIKLWWAERRIDGLIITDLWRDDQRIPLLEKLQIPAVLVGRPRLDSSAPAVWSDDAQAIVAAVDHLVGLGHQRIARVAGLSTLEHTEVRTTAFTHAMHERGLVDAEVLATDYSWEQGAEATRNLLNRPEPPTAIIFDNDLMAVAALGVARELNVSIPTDLSIIAGDDSQLCALAHPTLTALSRDVSAYGAHTAKTLLEAVAGHAPPSFQDDAAQLIPRASTAAPSPRDRRS